MKAEIVKLIKVKSLVTLMLSFVFCILAFRGTVSGEQFVTIFTTVIAFYFGTQSGKKDKEE